VNLPLHIKANSVKINWYKMASGLIITGPHDGKGHMTSDDPSVIFEAKIDNKPVGYILVVMPEGKYPFVGQVTVKESERLKGVATALYARVDSYLKENKKNNLRPSRDLSPGSRRIWDKRLNSGIGKESQNLTPQQIALYHNFKQPNGIKLIGSGLSAVFQVPGINQTINGSQLINQVIGRIQGVLTKNNVHTIDTSPVPKSDAIGLAMSSEPGTVHVDIAKILNTVKNQALPSITQLDGIEVDKDIQTDIIGKISNFITNQLANTAAHESKHNMDYFKTFPKGQFQSSENEAEVFGDQTANQYFRL
jgi:hypothetical protein